MNRHYDVLAVTETFVCENQPDDHLSLEGFNFFRVDREGQLGGGVGAYVRNYFTVKILAQSHGNIPEFIVLELINEQTKILFAVVYRKPASAYPTKFFECLSPFLPQFTNVIVTGDFNLNMCEHAAGAANLRDLIESHSLSLVSSEPTHHTFCRDRPPTHTWLDLFIVKDPAAVLELKKSESPFIAGHDFIEINYRCSKPQHCTKQIYSRCLHKVSPDAQVSAVQTNFAHLPPFSAVDHRAFLTSPAAPVVLLGARGACADSWQRQITASLIAAFDSVAPLRTITLSSKHKPWVSPAIRALMRKRNSAYHTAYASKNTADIERFKALRAEVCNKLDSPKNDYLANRLSQAPDANSKWKELRQMYLSAARLPSPLLYFNANVLNLHYATVVNCTPPLSEADFQTVCDAPASTSSDRHFDFRLVSEAEVRVAVMGAPSKSSGVDGISALMLKTALPVIVGPLTSLLNSCFVNATFPTDWKKALIVPLAKSKTLDSPSDTRSIAQLPELSKVLERLAHEQLLGYLETHRLLDERQAGSRKGHSTQTALLGVLEDVRKAVDEGKITILILFDFSKAFDTIPHARLLAKLRALNVGNRTLRWFYNYLADRLQAVVDDGALSPTGSALLPGSRREVFSAPYYLPFISMIYHEYYVFQIT